MLMVDVEDTGPGWGGQKNHHAKPDLTVFYG